MCMRCSYIPNPNECSTVTECGDHETCSTLRPGRRTVNTNGRFLVCEECCNSTTCNSGGQCNSKPLNYHGGHLCYNCDQQVSPTGCDRITLCSQDRVCYIGQKVGGLSGNVYYETRCALPKSDCPFGGQSPVFGKRSAQAFCSHCCSGNLCNNVCPPSANQIATSSPTYLTPPLVSPAVLDHPAKITGIAGVNNVAIGADVRLLCSTSGNPVPTVKWSRFDGIWASANVRTEARGHVLVIENYHRHNDGQYICIASNPSGRDYKIVTLNA